MNEIRQPKIGDVVTPEGGILVNNRDGGTMIVTRGQIIIGMRKGLMALRYGWHVIKADGTQGDGLLQIEKH